MADATAPDRPSDASPATGDPGAAGAADAATRSPGTAARRRRGSATARRRRQVRWSKRLRRFGMAWQNALEIIRAGRLTAPYGHPFEVVHEERVYRLRHYAAPTGAATALPSAVLLVPPLMVASEIYDVAPDISAVVALGRAGVDVWLVDFGAPEREECGMSRTLDDHVRAVSEAVDRVRDATGHDVHLAGYSQGGMFAYQVAAFRKAAGLASVITFGSPVDLHRSLRGVRQDITERVVGALRATIEPALQRTRGLPGFLTSTGFRVLSARKEIGQLVDFVSKLHDRQALEKREAKRLFLRGEGFVAWPGPALRKFIDEVIVSNRMSSGGFVIDGHTVTLADITCPILYFVGERDDMARPAAVRGIRRATPACTELYEVPVKAGHFGLVVGSSALRVTWPTVVDWVRWLDHLGDRPAALIPVGDDGPVPPAATTAGDLDTGDHPLDDDDHEDDDYDGAFGELQFDLELAQDIVGKAARAVWDRVGDASDDLGDYLDNLRWQLPRLSRLRRLRDDTRISVGATLAEQAAEIPDRTFFLWRGRAFTYADANRRVEAVVRGLISCGVRPGQRIGVMMGSRPSHLTAVTALSRLGAVAVLLSPITPDRVLPRAIELGELDALIVDPEEVERSRRAFAGPVLVLGGANDARALPAGVVDMERIDADAVALPGWYRPDPGRARDLAMVFVTAGRYGAPRASRVTNRRWAFSALGAAATCTLSSRDTVYCCLPLHHPAGQLVAAGSALVGGARLALASKFEPATFWQEVRSYGVTVVFYAGEMCRALVDAPHEQGEKNHPVRLFAGSGMRVDLWRRLVDRFGPVGVLEFYASTEASAVLANASGEKLGALGRPLPGSPDLVVAGYDFDADDLIRDRNGRLVHARIDEPGMLVARLDGGRGVADIAHIDPRRILRDAFGPGDTWFVTGDLLRVDGGGDFWFVDRHGEMIRTADGWVASQRLEDTLYVSGAVALCIAVGVAGPGGDGHEVPAAALVAADGRFDLDAIARAVVSLPEHAIPQRLRRVDELPMTEGYRPLKKPVKDLGFADGPDVFAWDPHGRRYRPTA
ncbi:MAG: AMP-binding protein [Kofleriaceae bacterium]|nr:AMP-binding protein [Kofleriaceae bacterium]